MELTPEREYLLVTEFFADATELGEAEVDTQVIDDGLAIIRKLWDAGLAHRDIKPANLLVRDGRLLLIDVAFVQARPAPGGQAVDLANMMLCLALRSSPELVYEQALQFFTVEEITEGFAAARGLALPSQLRRLLRAQGRDLHAEFIRLPTPPQPVSIQRWSARRVGLLGVTAVLLAVLVVTIIGAVNNDNANRTSLDVHSLPCDDLEPLWLQAQAVPSASLVPCVRDLPVGWVLAEVAVNDDRSVIALHHDRAGQAMEARPAGCEIGGVAEAPASPGSGATSWTPPGAALHHGALRRLPGRLPDHPDHGPGDPPGRGRRGHRHHRLRLGTASARRWPSARRPAPARPGPRPLGPASSAIHGRRNPTCALYEAVDRCSGPPRPLTGTATPSALDGVAGVVALLRLDRPHVGGLRALGPWATSNSTAWPSFSER